MTVKPKPYPKNIEARDDELPTIFYIETALACNLRCPECFIGVGSNDRKKGLMSPEDFKSIWNKIGYAAELAYFFMWGEPTMNKHLPEFIKIASKDAHIQINTNGTLLNKDLLRNLYESGLGTLMFSIDGVTQEIYEKYRVGGNCQTAWNNLEMAAKLKEDENIKTEIIANIIAFKHNEHEIEEFTDKCKQIGVRSIVRPAYVRYGSVDQPTNNKYHHPYSETEGKQLKLISKCQHLNNTMTIGVGGETLLCTQDYGNIFGFPTLLDEKETLESLWNSKEYKAIRDNTRNMKSAHDICKNCVHYPLKK